MNNSGKMLPSKDEYRNKFNAVLMHNLPDRYRACLGNSRELSNEKVMRHVSLEKF